MCSRAPTRPCPVASFGGEQQQQRRRRCWSSTRVMWWFAKCYHCRWKQKGFHSRRFKYAKSFLPRRNNKIYLSLYITMCVCIAEWVAHIESVCAEDYFSMKLLRYGITWNWLGIILPKKPVGWVQLILWEKVDLCS